MKLSHLKSIGISLFLLGLMGCEQAEEVGLPHVFGANEVPPEVMGAPRVVTAPDPAAVQSATWMRLGDVPSAPKDFTSETLIEQTRQEMRDERADAERVKAAADMPPPIVSPPTAQP